MSEFAWPIGLMPYRVSFYLQPHVGGAESPLTRVRKVYELSAPRWIARLTFRGGYDGAPRLFDAGGYGPVLDSLIADLRGGAVLTRFHDFRRPYPTGALPIRSRLTVRAVPAGATSMTVDGFAPNAAALSLGDYVGGDGRPHLTSMTRTIAAGGRIAGAGSIMADGSGTAIIGFNPPLSGPINAGTPLEWPVTGLFELTGEDAGQNETEVGTPTEYTLDFVEHLR